MNPEGYLTMLMIEDNAGDRLLLREILERSGLCIRLIHEACSMQDARTLLENERMDAVLLDMCLPDCSGMSCYEAIRKIDRTVPVIVLTGLGDADKAVQAIQYGVQDYLVKGEFNAQVLEKSVRHSIERVRNLEQLRISEEKYRLMFAKNPFPSLIIDTSTLGILEVNEAALEAYGYTRKEFSCLPVAAIRMPGDRDRLLKTLWETAGEASIEKCVTHRKKNGALMIVDAVYFAIDYLGRPAVHAQISDITDKVQLQQALDAERVQKQRDMAAAVLEAQEKERTHLGQELHDNVNQIISSSRLYMDMVLGNHADVSVLSKAIACATLAIEENRKLSKTLVLPQLTGDGLLVSLQELRQEFMLSSSVNIKFSMQGVEENDFTDAEKVSLYRIVQEQLNNIVKHAEARSVLIRLYRQEGRTVLYIRDNGKGFDPSSRKGKGVGLVSMRHRAEVLRGQLTIDSSPGKGCVLSVVMKRA